jgi:hypothetical protein
VKGFSNRNVTPFRLFIGQLVIDRAESRWLNHGAPLGTTMWQAFQWICTTVALSCSAAPDVAVIQTAYEREESTGSTLHDKGLQVLEAKCHDNSGNEFLCEVTFISKSDPTERLYFDIVAVAFSGHAWVLKSGLCKR